MVERELAETGLDVFVKYAGNEIGFYSLDSITIKDLLETGMRTDAFSVSQDQEKCTFLVRSPTSNAIPSYHQA